MRYVHLEVLRKRALAKFQELQALEKLVSETPELCNVDKIKVVRKEHQDAFKRFTEAFISYYNITDE